MKPIVHQLVHGYQKGHSLLAGSCSIPKRALEIVTEQSDLSGPLPAGVSIPTYLTAYPVSGTEFYALGRSWPDADAPRTGCVITHTLLIPNDAWASAAAPEALLQLHTRPDRQSVDKFRETLDFPDSHSERTDLEWLRATDAEEFAAKVFSDGLRSIIWFDCESPDAVVMAVASLLWPALRGAFYAHTFSLSAHAKVKSDLQLHFAPRSAKSYFSGVPKQCHMSGRLVGGRGESEQEWIREIAEDLRAGHPRNSYVDGLKRYGYLLGSEPSSVRNLFALRDLTERVAHTPTAAVGILDIIESLEPAAEDAVREKRVVLDTALSAALNSETTTSLRCLSLIDARLQRPSFAAAGEEIQSALKESVKKIVAEQPHALIANGGNNTPSEASAFWQGATAGMQEAAETRPDSISSIAQSPTIAAFVVRQSPRVAFAYLHWSRERRAERVAQVIEWISHVEREEQRQHLRRELLVEATDDESAPLLAELLRDLSGSEVGNTLSVLAKTTEGFGNVSLRQVVVDFITQRFPEETIAWSRRTGTLQSNFIPEVVAEAFSPSQDGAEHVLSIRWTTPDDLCEIWSSFVGKISKTQLPQWFVRRVSEDSMFLEPFAQCNSLSARAVHALALIGNQCAYLPLARSRSFEAFVESIVDTPLSEIYIPKACDSAIAEHIAGRINNEQMLFALNLPPCRLWGEHVSGNHIHGLLASTSDRDAWQRAWITFSLLPQGLFSKVAGPRIISDFTKSFHAYWTEEVSTAWCTCLRRSNNELSNDASLRFQMLSMCFCLNHPRLPLGSVIREAFPPVYEAVSSGNVTQVTDDMFGYFDWDKAKKLRKDIIDAYVSSCWPAGDLALIAAQSQILRKVIHRLQRKWSGDDYIRKMLDDLQNGSVPEAVSIRAEVSAVINDPEFFEPWD